MRLSIIGHYFLLTDNCLWRIQRGRAKGRHRQNVVPTEKKSKQHEHGEVFAKKLAQKKYSILLRIILLLK